MENNSWVKLYRKLEEWRWLDEPNTFCLFIHLLLMANHKDTKWRGQEIKKGQLLTGRKQLSERTGLSERTIRTCLTRLKSTSEITIKSTNKFSIISICNWDNYQSKTTSRITSYPPNKRPANDQQPTTSKNVKNVKKVKNREHSLAYLSSMGKEEAEILSASFPLTGSEILNEASAAADWVTANGKRYQDYKAFFRNWLRRSVARKKVDARKGGGYFDATG